MVCDITNFLNWGILLNFCVWSYRNWNMAKIHRVMRLVIKSMGIALITILTCKLIFKIYNDLKFTLCKHRGKND